MTAIDKVRMQQIKQVVNDALEKAKPGDFPDDAINWGDLSVCDVCFNESLGGMTGYTVLIEEASPESSDLHAYIITELEKAGLGIIAVRTEW